MRLSSYGGPVQTSTPIQVITNAERNQTKVLGRKPDAFIGVKLTITHHFTYNQRKLSTLAWLALDPHESSGHERANREQAVRAIDSLSAL